jgi:hypothetical protein
VILEIILPDHQASAHGEDLKERLADRHAATRSVPADLARDEKAISEIEQFLGIDPKILEALQHASPNLQVAVMAVKGPAYVEEYPGPVKLDIGIKTNEEHIEIAPVPGRESMTYATNKDRAAQPRVARESPPRGTQPLAERGESDDDPFIQSAVSPRIGCERDSDAWLHVLLRHRPRSIPQAQESA